MFKVGEEVRFPLPVIQEDGSTKIEMRRGFIREIRTDDSVEIGFPSSGIRVFPIPIKDLEKL